MRDIEFMRIDESRADRRRHIRKIHKERKHLDMMEDE
jgi:hypothetical protein